jgi:Zn-dependent peptidase ImmA (M78 family)
MPPLHIEEVTETGGVNRVEQLANTFASALLMPARIVESAADWRTLRGDAMIAQLNATADRLEVTATALLWRLVSLELLDRVEARATDSRRIAARKPRGTRALPKPPLFSRRFVEIVARAVEEGRVSVRKIASLLGLSVDDLGDLFATHSVPAPYEL